MFTTIQLQINTIPTVGVSRRIVKYPILINVTQNNTLLHTSTTTFDQDVKLRVNLKTRDPINLTIQPATDNHLNLVDFPVYVTKLVLDEAYATSKFKFFGQHYDDHQVLLEKNTNTLYSMGKLVYTFTFPIIGMVLDNENITFT